MTATLLVHVDLAGECTSVLTYPVSRGSKVVGPKVEMKSGLANLWTGWKFKTGPPGAVELVLAQPGSGGSATSMPRSWLQKSAKVSGSAAVNGDLRPSD